jgi:hypothetical protein
VRAERCIRVRRVSILPWFAEDVGGVPAGDAEHAGLERGGEHGFEESLPGFEVFAADGGAGFLCELNHAGQIDGEVGRTVGEGDAFHQRGVGIELRGGNRRIIVVEPGLEGGEGCVDGGGLDEDFSRAAPENDDAVYGCGEGLDVRAELLREVAFRAALLYVGAAQALDVVLVEDGGHGPDRFKEGLDGFKLALLENIGGTGGFVHVFVEDVPAGEDDVLELRKGCKCADERGAILSALTEADMTHLRERTDGLGETVAYGLHAGDERGGNGAHADEHDAEFAGRGPGYFCYLWCVCCIACFHCGCAFPLERWSGRRRRMGNPLRCLARHVSVPRGMAVWQTQESRFSRVTGIVFPPVLTGLFRVTGVAAAYTANSPDLGPGCLLSRACCCVEWVVF